MEKQFYEFLKEDYFTNEDINKVNFSIAIG